MFRINIQSGYKNIELSTNYGNTSIITEPSEGDVEGDLIIQYEPTEIKNVDYQRTIAGSDNISVRLIDQEEIFINENYTIITQPEPLLGKDYLVPSHDTEFSRVKVDPYLIRYLNERDNFSLGCYNSRNFGESTNFNQNGNEFDLFRDVAFVDLNLDGYDDIVIHPNYWDGEF